MDINFQIEPVFNSLSTRTIVFAPSNDFVKYFGVALQSLIDNSKNHENYDIIVLESDISERNKSIILRMLPPNFSLRFFNVNDFILQILGDVQLTTRGYWSISTYYRIFIPLIMRKYDRVLYCDSDIVFNEPVTEIFNMDFEGKKLIAIPDTISNALDRFPRQKKVLLRNLKLEHPEKYFNAGICMFNIPAIDPQEYIDLCKNILTTKKLLFQDQDLLNTIFNNDVKLVSCRWNTQAAVTIYHKGYLDEISGDYKADFIAARKNPAIIHYISNHKPWCLPEEELSDIFWHYARRCPFYEEILFANIKDTESIRNLNLKGRVYLNFYYYRLLSLLVFGKKRQYYRKKYDEFKLRVRDIRKFSRL